MTLQPPRVAQDANNQTLIDFASKEILSFVSAVYQLHGEQHAERAGGYWLETFEATQFRENRKCKEELRQISIHAAARLAGDITGKAHSRSAG